MLSRNEFRKQVLVKALLKIQFNPLTMKLQMNLRDYYSKNHIIMYQERNTIYVQCMDNTQFKIFAKTHFNSWWVLREGDVSAISSLPLLVDMEGI